MSDVRLYLFGIPRIEYNRLPVRIERRKALALAAYLACAEHRQSRDALADLLWPDLDRDHGRTALRSALLALTAQTPDGWIEADRTTLALKRDATWTDLAAFSALLAGRDAHGHPPAATCEQCAARYEQAMALYQSGFMAGFTLPDCADYTDWQMAQREWLRREYAEMLYRLTTHYADARQYAQAIEHARRWLATDPLHEPAHRQLMRLYAANGQRSEALRQYKQCAALLDAELATPPEDETTRLYSDILNGHMPVIQAHAHGAAATSVLPPFPAPVIGRDEALSEIKRRLGIGGGMRPTTVIQGWPGVGKSSIAALLAHDQQVAQHFPDGVLWTSLGEHPGIPGQLAIWADALNLTEPGRATTIEELRALLAAALRDRRMLLLVDDVWQVEHATPFRLGGQHCAVVITSRLNDVATSLAPVASDIYRLPVLTDEAALTLLGQLAPETVQQFPGEAGELVRDLEGLPLAIHVAGRLLQSEARLGWGVHELLQELRTGSSLLRAHAPSDMRDMRDTRAMRGASMDADTTPTVAALLKRSTDMLDAPTRLRFAYLGLFVPKPATFDLDAMAVAWDVADARPTARTLVSRGLLEPVGGGRFQMHSLLVLHARSLLEEGAPP